MNDNDDDIVAAFLEESRENLDQLDRDLIVLEADPSDTECLAQVFRTIHTIKGTCGFLGFHRLEALTHAGEHVLAALRSGDLRLDAGITTALLALVDSIRAILDVVEAAGNDGDGDDSGVIGALDRHLAIPLAAPAAAGTTTWTDETLAPTTLVAEASVRVGVTVLDKLMDLVGELVLIRSQFAESPTTGLDGALRLPYRQLDIITSELQEEVLRSRLQPVGTATGRLRRVVRDLVAVTGKRLVFEIHGEEIAVDKAVNEALRDPLLHLVRNAVDHGIELPAERLAAGKPAQGRLTLRALHVGGRLHIELADDGRGIDAGRVVDKAISSGLITPDEAATLSPADALELVFRPGLSTKDEITNISGRGVGLDVVRAALERLGGSIEVFVEPGRASVFQLNLPLTLAIMPVLIASVGQQRFAVPQVDVREVLHVDAADLATTTHEVGGARVHRLRDRLLPLVDLAAQLEIDPSERAGLTIIVVETAHRGFGIVVDGVGETMDVVVKPLTQATRAIRLFGGVTILSDGEPSLIVDIAGLASSAGITASRAIETDRGPAAAGPTGSMVLLAAGNDGRPVAVGMDVVSRLEQIASSTVERSGRREVVRYEGGILPLVRLADVLPDGRPATEPPEVLHAVVCHSSMGLVGLVVGRILDVVPEPTAGAQPPPRAGVAASIVVNGLVTELLDVETLVAAAVGRTA